MKCSVCGNEIYRENGMYVCKCCNFSAKAPSLDSIDVFICCTQVSRYGTMTPGSMMAHSLYVGLSEKDINVFYSAEYFPEYPSDGQKSDFFVAMENAPIIIITGLDKKDFETALNYYGSRFRGKTILPVYSTMQENDIVNVPGMLSPVSYDTPDSIDNVCKEIKNALTLLESHENNSSKPPKKINIGFIVGLALAFVLVIAIFVYFLFIGPGISNSNDYSKAQSLAKEGKYTQAIDIYYHLGNYKDSVDLLGKVYSKYNGFYRDDEKMIELDLNIVNGVGKIKINEYYGSKIISAKTSAKIKNNILEFDYKDSYGNSGNGVIELFDDSIVLTVNSLSASKLCLTSGTVKFKLGETSEPTVTADLENLEKRDFVNWLNNAVTVKMLKDDGYPLKIDEENSNSDSKNTPYIIIGTDVKLMFNGQSESSVILSVCAPAEIVTSGKIGEIASPFEQNDVVFWPGENIYGLNTKTVDVSDYLNGEKFRKTTLVTVVTKKSFERYGTWDSLLKVIFDIKLSQSVDSDEHKIVSQNAEKYLVSVEESTSLKFYAVDKNTFESDYITRLRFDSDMSEDDKNDLWMEHSELFEDFADKKAEKPTGKVYKVRKSANDADSQIGAFVELENAKKLADSKKDEGYKVYDENGNILYIP